MTFVGFSNPQPGLKQPFMTADDGGAKQKGIQRTKNGQKTTHLITLQKNKNAN